MSLFLTDFNILYLPLIFFNHACNYPIILELCFEVSYNFRIMVRKLVTYNSQNYAGTLGSDLEAGSINLSINRSNIVRSCSAVRCANRDTKDNCV